jgi:flavin-dependent dehydrogenase
MVEVLVVGAGPAGLVTATVLARAGIRVLVLERARFPRHKLCGDTLNPGTIARLRRLEMSSAAEARGLTVAGMIVTGARGTRVEGRYPGGQKGLAIKRSDLDGGLLQCALDAGARVEEGVQVRAPLVDEQGSAPRVRGVVLATAGGRTIRMPACITVAADGRHSTLAFALGLAWHPRRQRRWAIGAYFSGVGGLTDFGEMHVRSDHYVGIAAVPGGSANVGLVTADRRGLDDPERLLRDQILSDPLLRDRFRGATADGPVVMLGPLAVDASASGMPGLLLAGDAGGFVDPMTGDGLRFAVEGGELAARAALQMLEDGSVTGYANLARWRRRAFRGKLVFDRTVRTLAGSPAGVRSVSAAVRVAPFLMRRMVAVAGDAI